MLGASSSTPQKVEQASSSSADGKNDGDSIESKFSSLKLTCHDPEHSDSAASSEVSSGEDSRTQPRSVIDYYTSADTDGALSGAGELATLTIMALWSRLSSVVQCDCLRGWVVETVYHFPGFDYVLEVYSFSPSLRTKDIISELLVYG